LDDLITESGAAYTVLDTLLKYGGSFMEKGHAFSGSFDLSLDMDALLGAMLGGGESEAATPLTISGTAAGLFDKGGEEMSLNLKTNLSDLAAQLPEDEPLDEETQALLEQLGDVDLDLIVNGDAGLMYLKSPLISTLADVPDDTWISFETEGAGLTSDLMDIFGGYGYSNVGVIDTSSPVTREGSFKEYIKNSLRIQLLDLDSDIAETLDGLNRIFSDQAMTRDGDTYTVTMTTESDEDDWYYSSDTLTLTFDLGGGTFQGASVKYSSESGNEYYDFGDSYGEDDASEDEGWGFSVTKTELSVDYTADGHGSLTFSTAVDDVTALSLTMDVTFSETTQTPAREPAPGSAVISVDDIPGIVTPEEDDSAA
jgi:hypothetical protein